MRKQLWLHLSSYRGFWLAILLLTLAYFMKSAEFELAGMDPVLMAWALIAIPIIFFCKKKSLLFVLSIYLWLFLWFAIGLAKSDYDADNFSLMRLFFSFPLLSALTVFYLNGTRESTTEFSILLEISVLFLLGWLVLFIYREQAYVSYAVREYGATNYLTISDLVGMLALTTIFGRRLPIWLRVGWIFLGLFACFLLGSRTSMVAFTLSLAIGMLVSVRLNLIGRLAAFSATVVLLLFSLLVFLSSFDNTITYRLLSLTELGADASTQARREFFWNHIQRVQMDVSCFLTPCFPPPGDYVHNAVSLHQYFGIGGGIFLIVCVGVFMRAYMRGWRPAAIPLLLFCALELLVARAWLSLVFPVIVGFLVAAIWFLKDRRKIRADADGYV